MKNKYSIKEKIKNIISLIYTKFFYKKARLIRRPIYIRGKKLLEYGNGFTTGYNCRIEMFGDYDENIKKIVIGNNCKIGDNVHLTSKEKIEIGDNVLVASHVFISDNSHGEYKGTINDSDPNIPPDERKIISNPVKIGDNTWIGENVCVLLGVNIGKGCIIGANSVVNKDVPDYCIAAGTPAKVIKKYNFTTKIWERV